MPEFAPWVSVPARWFAGLSVDLSASVSPVKRKNRPTICKSRAQGRERPGCDCGIVPRIMLQCLLCRPSAGAARLEAYPG